MSVFERFTEHRQLLDDEFDGSIQYDPLPGKKACRIHIDQLHGDVLDADPADPHDPRVGNLTLLAAARV